MKTINVCKRRMYVCMKTIYVCKRRMHVCVRESIVGLAEVISKQKHSFEWNVDYKRGKWGEFSDHKENGQDTHWAQKMNVIKDCNVNIISLCLKWTTLLGDVNYTATLLCGHSAVSPLCFSNQLLFIFFLQIFFTTSS